MRNTKPIRAHTEQILDTMADYITLHCDVCGNVYNVPEAVVSKEIEQEVERYIEYLQQRIAVIEDLVAKYYPKASPSSEIIRQIEEIKRDIEHPKPDLRLLK